MKQDVLDVLVYLFQNYISDETEVHADRESVQNELLDAGFPFAEVDKALQWLDDLAGNVLPSATALADAERSFRIFTPKESEKLDTDARGFMIELEHAGIITAHARELILDRVMALETVEIDIEQIKWVILMVLFNQPGQEEAYAWMEDLIFDGYGAYVH